MMILRQTLLGTSSKVRPNSLSKYGHGHGHKRLASVTSQIFQSQPERPPRTNFLEKYQEKLERKAKECATMADSLLTGQGRSFEHFRATRALSTQNSGLEKEIDNPTTKVHYSKACVLNEFSILRSSLYISR